MITKARAKWVDLVSTMRHVGLLSEAETQIIYNYTWSKWMDRRHRERINFK